MGRKRKTRVTKLLAVSGSNVDIFVGIITNYSMYTENLYVLSLREINLSGEISQVCLIG